MTELVGFLELIEKQREAAQSIKGTAGEINMISINAAIESAHAAAGIRTMMEKVLDGLMTSVCRMLARLLESRGVSLEVDGLIEFAKWAGIDEIFITDGEGVTVGTNIPPALGWRFPEDPKAQAFVFRSLINSQDGVVTQAMRVRDLDSKVFKFVGVSRIDEPGIVQIGFGADSINRYQVEIGAVFGVLATEIKNLGSRVTGASKMIAEVTAEMEKNVKK
jgi:hypothetical protein